MLGLLAMNVGHVGRWGIGRSDDIGRTPTKSQ